MSSTTSSSNNVQVVLVTGCSKGGIGFYLCEEFAERGCIVYASSRSLKTMEGFRNGRIHTIEMDVTKDDDVEAAIKRVIEEQGRIDILVNNAGIICPGPVIDVPIQQAKETFDINVFGVLRTCRAVIPHMAVRKQGKILNIGSMVGEIPTPWNGVYCASKAALHSITEALQMECTPFDISVTLMVTGGVYSNLALNASKVFRLPPDSLYSNFYEQILRRMNISQSPGSMPTGQFARETVSKMLVPKPSRRLKIGGNIRLISFMLWLPRALVLRLIWRSFSKP